MTMVNNEAVVENSAAANGRFDIVIRYSGDPTYQTALTQATARWSQIITGDIPALNSSQYGLIDDLLIDASIVAIDGAGGILGQPGRTVRSSSRLPAHGEMEFDSADVATTFANGTWTNVSCMTSSRSRSRTWSRRRRNRIHLAVRRQPGWRRPQQVRSGLSEDSARAVDRNDTRVDQQVVDQSALAGVQVRNVAGDDLRPSRRRLGESRLVGRIAAKADDDVETPVRRSGVLDDACIVDHRHDGAARLEPHRLRDERRL